MVERSKYILPDVLEHNLITVFCGRAPSPESARQRAYYAHPSNKFWKALAATGLTDRRLSPSEYQILPNYGIGLTDINKSESGSDHELSGSGDSPADVLEKVRKFKPYFLAFNGKNNCRMFIQFAFKERRIIKLDYGLQAGYEVGSTKVFLLPNTSARAIRFWKPEYWRAFAHLHKSLFEARNSKEQSERKSYNSFQVLN